MTGVQTCALPISDNCLKLQRYGDTEAYLKQASAMCPVKFMPLYKLAELYIKTEQKEEARILALIILEKRVKVESAIINNIRFKARDILKNIEAIT